MFAPYVYIELPLGSSVFGKWDIGSSHIQELSQKISEAYKQYFLCKLDFCVCSVCIYWAPSRELQEGAQCLYNVFSVPYAFRSSQKKFRKSSINIVSAIFILLYMYPRQLYCPKNFNAHPGAKFEQYSNSWSYIVLCYIYTASRCSRLYLYCI